MTFNFKKWVFCFKIFTMYVCIMCVCMYYVYVYIMYMYVLCVCMYNLFTYLFTYLEVGSPYVALAVPDQAGLPLRDPPPLSKDLCHHAQIKNLQISKVPVF